ncbi:NAD(P)-binding protein [Apiospora arundinis]
MVVNKGLIFKKAPEGFPVPGEHLTIEDIGFDADAAPPKGGITAEVLYASYDPYLRGRMRNPGTKSYATAFDLGKPIVNDTIARVLKSDSPDHKAGDLIKTFGPVQQYISIDINAPVQSVYKVNPAQKLDNPHNLEPGFFLGALGMPGLTAYSSLHEIGKPKKGETIFVSSAAGAVGQIVGQVAKHEGLTVIGSVGSDEKLEFITKELGFDGGFNYKTEKPADALKRLAPNGIDIYFENVGGEHLEAALDAMNEDGRVVVCGMIEGYNCPPEKRYGVKNLFQLVAKHIEMRGFLVGQPAFGPAYTKEHQANVQKWLADGSLKAKLHVTEGIDNGAEGFIGMLKGENFGKAVLKIKA